MWHDQQVLSALSIVVRILSDLVGGFSLAWRPRTTLEAEILFLRRQLALYVERQVKPRRIDVATRVSLVLLSRLFEWRSALVVVRPETLIRCTGRASGSYRDGSHGRVVPGFLWNCDSSFGGWHGRIRCGARRGSQTNYG